MKDVKKFGKFVFIAAVLAAVYSMPIRSSEWTSLGSNNAKQRHSSESGVDEAMTLAWKYTIPSGAPIASSPVVSNGIVVFGARDGKTYAIDINASNSAGSAVSAWGGALTVAGAITVDATSVIDGNRVYIA